MLDKHQPHKKCQRSFSLCRESWSWAGVGIGMPESVQQSWMLKCTELVCYQLLPYFGHFLKIPAPVLLVLAFCHHGKLPEIKLFTLAHGFMGFSPWLLSLITLKTCGDKTHDDGSLCPTWLLTSWRLGGEQSERKG